MNPDTLTRGHAKTRTPAQALDRIEDIMEVFEMDLRGPNLVALEIGKKLATWNKAGCVLIIIALASRINKMEKECTCKAST